MDKLLHVGLGNAAAATALALLAAAAGRVCRRPAVLHGLWLLVLLKLVTPPLVNIPIPWPVAAEDTPAPEAGTPAATGVPALPAIGPEPLSAGAPILWHDAPCPPAGDGPAPAATRPVEPAARPPTPAAAAAPAAPASPRWELIVAALWLAGSALWWAAATVQVFRFRRLLRHARPAPPCLLERAECLAACLGLRCCPAVWLVPAPVPPLLWSLGRAPLLLLPSALWDRLSPEQQDTVLAHELAHLRRRDHWVRWLELLALGLYWWLPIAWWARRRLQEAQELCCDAWVVEALPASATPYAEALVEAAAFLSRRRHAALPAGASGVGQFRLMKRRLTMILTGTRPKALSRTGRLALLALGAALLPLLPGPAQGEIPAREGPQRRRMTEDRWGDTPAPAAATTVVAAGKEEASMRAADRRAIRPPAPDSKKLAPQMVNSRRIRLDYEIKDVGPSGVSSVDLWSTRDGVNWEKRAASLPPKPPFDFEVPSDGLYGLTLVVRGGSGKGARAPQAGEKPQVWVEVDVTPPEVKLFKPAVTRDADGAALTLTWKATDKNLGPKPIDLSYATRPGGPWLRIAHGLENTGRYKWKVPPEAPARLWLRIRASDQAGNVAVAATPEPVVIDLAQPKGIIRGVKPLPEGFGGKAGPVRERGGPVEDGFSYHNHRSFAIPIQVDPSSQPRLRKLRLFASSDGGGTWRQAAQATPDQKAFRFTAPVDGPYLFAIQTENQEGHRQPETPDRGVPALKVWVDTEPPVVLVRAGRPGDGELVVEWEARDDHLDLPSLALAWRRAGEDAWRPLKPVRAPEGRLCRKPAPRGPVEVRLRVRDRAGNAAEKTVMVPEGR